MFTVYLCFSWHLAVRWLPLSNSSFTEILLIKAVVGYLEGLKKGDVPKTLGYRCVPDQFDTFFKKISVEKWDGVGQKMATAVGL